MRQSNRQEREVQEAPSIYKRNLKRNEKTKKHSHKGERAKLFENDQKSSCYLSRLSCEQIKE